MSDRTILIMAAGTGGHIFPALSIAKLLQGQGVSVEWLGTPTGMENQVLEGTGIRLHKLPVSGLRGKGKLALLKAPFMLMSSIWEAARLIRKLRPCCVLGMGGYVTGPGGIASWLLRRPLLIHEQNAVAGLSNRLLAPFSARVMEAFPGTFNASAKVIATGNPVRAEIETVGQDHIKDFDGNQPLRLLILGGSLGATAINTVLPGAILAAGGGDVVEVWHQTGRGKLEETRQCYARAGLEESERFRVVAFIDDMASAYRWADLVLCRAGAGVVFELAAAGVASLLVPYPHAVDDHQSRNAQWLVQAGAALLIAQTELSEARLAHELMELRKHPAQLQSMAAAAAACAVPHAAQKLTSICLEVCNG
jgi:UDP-N-acetylglucosamine--N-acetylmuramyl-(pentapeptide) pyrophosphoryl-undecaprenol N-acetylglucosamine transferase